MQATQGKTTTHRRRTNSPKGSKMDVSALLIFTNNAINQWEETRDWNGQLHISRATGSSRDHQTLYETYEGRYYIMHYSDKRNSFPSAELISAEKAAKWLTLNNYGNLLLPFRPSELLKPIQMILQK